MLQQKVCDINLFRCTYFRRRSMRLWHFSWTLSKDLVFCFGPVYLQTFPYWFPTWHIVPRGGSGRRSPSLMQSIYPMPETRLACISDGSSAECKPGKNLFINVVKLISLVNCRHCDIENQNNVQWYSSLFKARAWWLFITNGDIRQCWINNLNVMFTREK